MSQVVKCRCVVYSELGHSQGFYKLLHADSFACSELTYAISEYIRSTADSYNNITSVFVPVYRLL